VRISAWARVVVVWVVVANLGRSFGVPRTTRDKETDHTVYGWTEAGAHGLKGLDGFRRQQKDGGKLGRKAPRLGEKLRTAEKQERGEGSEQS
jgi:hypothetical protein